MHTPLDKQRAKSLQYFLCGKRVCKNVLNGTLGITSSRLSYLIEKKNNSGVVSPDQRGRAPPKNKVPDETISILKSFLHGIPKYTCDDSDSDSIYFPPTLTWKKLLDDYCSAYPEHSVSMFIFMREIKKYNMQIYLPKKDIIYE